MFTKEEINNKIHEINVALTELIYRVETSGREIDPLRLLESKKYFLNTVYPWLLDYHAMPNEQKARLERFE